MNLCGCRQYGIIISNQRQLLCFVISAYQHILNINKKCGVCMHVIKIRCQPYMDIKTNILQ